MYMDAVVIAGIVTVLMILGFLVGVAVFVVRDQKINAFRREDQKKAGKGSAPS